ncbi:MAG TPA: 3-deoxy-7-phosphoheptulonate synthase, partial [Thermomicrobiales bacterium]|nr:3-deoxy-7-phosphoheptulonate synthase [Thermomicrobiales bacterium]
QGTTLLISGDNPKDVAELLTGNPAISALIPSEATRPPVTSNLRIAGIRPLVPPAILVEQLPLPPVGAELVHHSRHTISEILAGKDDRLMVVVGPCSVHDVDAAMAYASLLKPVADRLAKDLLIVMRVYFEKPRTTVGWKGLINDPNLDGSFAVNAGLTIARRLLLDIVAMGLPAGTEFLDPITPQFITDAVSWGAIGARTTESQVHRNLSSGLSMPIGFKNGTTGDVQIAIDAMLAASHRHQFMTVTEQGLAAIVETRGNLDTHLILRGGAAGPNCDATCVSTALDAIQKHQLPRRVMIDASHGNSSKDYRKQPAASAEVAAQVAAGDRAIIGVMLESFIEDGKQDLKPGLPLTYGQSITDGCMGWEMTLPVLEELAAAVRTRRTT